MGEVELHFKAAVPTFDACVFLGRRYNRYVRSDSVAGIIESMDRCGVGKALVSHVHAIDFDGEDGNEVLLQEMKGQPRLVPQFGANPTMDDAGQLIAQMRAHGVRSVRIDPKQHNYPFTDWMAKGWLDRLAKEGISVFVAAPQIEPDQLHTMLRAHPDLRVVLSEVHYVHTPWIFPLVRAVPNVYVEISRFVVVDGPKRLVDAMGLHRVLFGSRFPDSAMAPHLYGLHQMGFTKAELSAICAGNLEKLLGRAA
ncbi:MAG: hypothetical protein FJ319_05970 [SAR202 cluster bacterium]|nr:hypothetical protein [SAR202 cluster bacterium]